MKSKCTSKCISHCIRKSPCKWGLHYFYCLAFWQCRIEHRTFYENEVLKRSIKVACQKQCDAFVALLIPNTQTRHTGFTSNSISFAWFRFKIYTRQRYRDTFERNLFDGMRLWRQMQLRASVWRKHTPANKTCTRHAPTITRYIWRWQKWAATHMLKWTRAHLFGVIDDGFFESF